MQFHNIYFKSFPAFVHFLINDNQKIAGILEKMKCNPFHDIQA